MRINTQIYTAFEVEVHFWLVKSGSLINLLYITEIEISYV